MIRAVDTNVLLDLLIPGSSAMDSAVDQLEWVSTVAITTPTSPTFPFCPNFKRSKKEK